MVLVTIDFEKIKELYSFIFYVTQKKLQVCNDLKVSN